MTTEHLWPSGAVTFLFTDIEDSTPMWDRHRAAMRPALAEHDALLQTAVESNGGFLVKTTGDGVHAVFASPSAALSSALDAQRALQDAQWPTIAPDKIRVRIGLHTGEAELRAGDYYGTAVNRAARLMSIGHGGQILLSGTTAALIRGSLPNDANLLDLGEHHLKGLSRPARVLQVETAGLPHDFPPLHTGEAAKGNLPLPLTAFIGREKELADIEQLLGETRLLTLTGPGGTGKTRLSLEAGRHVEGIYDHGVWLAELAPLTDGDLIPATVAGLFDLREQPGAPIMSSLTDYLRGKKLLLILDNCEHLVAACAQLAVDLLPVAPQLTILASSREGLSVPGETTVHISAMDIPTRDMVDRDEVARFETVRLFVARAKAAKPRFELTADNSESIGQIVRRLDGIPLAIELAAARIKLMSPAQIAARLDDRFRLLTGGSRTALPRQQTLRALIDWSYDLLDEQERWLLRQIAIIGGWTLEAAEYVVESPDPRGLEQAVAAADPTAAKNLVDLDALDLLANLVNKSLVRIDDSGDDVRYFYLETIRQYARDKLYEAGEGPGARDRHFAYFLRMAGEDYGGNLKSFSSPQRLTRLEIDLDNLRAALEWGAGRDPVEAINLLRYMSVLWTVLGFGDEGRRRAETLLQALAALPAQESEATVERRLARAYGLGFFALGAATSSSGEDAFTALEEAITILRDEGAQPTTLADALFLQTLVAIETGHPQGYERARETYEIAGAINNRELQQMALLTMARWALTRGEIDHAAGYVAEARQLKTGLSMPILIVGRAFVESMIARASGDLAAALRVLNEGAEALRLTRSRHFANVLDSELAHTLRQSGDLAGAIEIYRRTILEWQDMGRRGAVANQLECFAFIAVAEKQFQKAAQLFGAAEALREAVDREMLPEEKKAYDASVANLGQGVEPAALEEAWQAGRVLDLDAAVELALNEGEIDGI